jgi:hypothetical protein|tara:strand:+ start:657 stop:830 length:174 start_codon:yes stop_codon:yes gene_type:complete
MSTKTRKDTLKMWEDAPVNATGSAVSTDVPIVKKKNKNKDQYEPAQLFDLIRRNSKV